MVIALAQMNLSARPERAGRLRHDVHVTLAGIGRRPARHASLALLAAALLAALIGLGTSIGALAAG
jgi:hypothetical protein